MVLKVVLACHVTLPMPSCPLSPLPCIHWIMLRSCHSLAWKEVVATAADRASDTVCSYLPHTYTWPSLSLPEVSAQQ